MHSPNTALTSLVPLTSAAPDGLKGNAKYVNYLIGNTQRVFMQFHLERVNRHENRYCIRFSFFWNEDTNQVVVGWLPSHLSNRIC